MKSDVVEPAIVYPSATLPASASDVLATFLRLVHDVHRRTRARGRRRTHARRSRRNMFQKAD